MTTKIGLYTARVWDDIYGKYTSTCTDETKIPSNESSVFYTVYSNPIITFAENIYIANRFTGFHTVGMRPRYNHMEDSNMYIYRARTARIRIIR
jgi:hypothetical protein